MPELDDATLDFLLARAGLSPTAGATGRTEGGLSARSPRWRNACASRAAAWRNLALTYGFAEEDLA